MPARKIDFYLNSSSSLRTLAGAAKRVAELQQVFLENAPEPLAQACRVKQLRAGTLVLLAEHAAVAAKLRQLAPRLLSAYGKLGLEVTSIHIEVQVAESPQAAPAPRAARELSIESIEELEKLAESLEASPLRDAVTRLATRQRNSRR